jgi:hypothetical protein
MCLNELVDNEVDLLIMAFNKVWNQLDTLKDYKE